MPSKFFRVALEGATTDGRKIDRTWIEQMAANFDPKKYGARVWLEHIRGITPDGPFRAYGDVLALEAREEDGKLGLYAQIEPTPELVKLTKSRQKIYTSIEVAERFADTGQAYLMGIAVTDSPASLGTDILEFSARNPAGSPLTGRKQHPDNLFSAGIETVIDLDGDEDTRSLADRVREMFTTLKARSGRSDRHFADASEAIELVVQHVGDLETELGKFRTQMQEGSEGLKKLQGDLDSLRQELSATPAQRYTQRPPATGADPQCVTDC